MVALLLAGCGSDSPATETSTAIVPATSGETQQPVATPAVVAVEIGNKVGQKAPDFMLTTVEGEQVSLEGFQGQPLLIYFYATW
jgi:cytochrome oxidase Cu insertion factor (SCO1/SenC/PrrC family)